MSETLLPATRRDAIAETAFRLLDTNGAAAALNVGRRTIQERVADGSLGCVRIGRAVRFHPDDIAAFIERNRRKAIGWKGVSRA